MNEKTAKLTQLAERKTRAIEKARRVLCEVEPSGLDTYEVSTPEGRVYTVRFAFVEGVREAFCACAAGYTEIDGIEYRNPCYHGAHAATLDSLLTGYPMPDASLFVALVMRRKGDEVFSDEQWADLRLRVNPPNLYWQRRQACAEVAQREAA